MAKEIERKFIVDTSLWAPEGTPFRMEQAYLTIETDKVIRVRISNNQAYITIKGNVQGITRDEFEYEIPVQDAKAMMKMCIGSPVIKTRWEFEYAGKIWEVDVFDGENKGLVVAEIELESEDEIFEKPSWAGEEVSTDVKYYNFNLSLTPYSKWQ